MSDSVSFEEQEMLRFVRRMRKEAGLPELAEPKSSFCWWRHRLNPDYESIVEDVAVPDYLGYPIELVHELQVEARKEGSGSSRGHALAEVGLRVQDRIEAEIARITKAEPGLLLRTYGIGQKGFARKRPSAGSAPTLV